MDDMELTTDQKIELLKVAATLPSLRSAANVFACLQIYHRLLCDYIVTGEFPPEALSESPSIEQPGP
jgi:hypothetical protein